MQNEQPYKVAGFGVKLGLMLRTKTLNGGVGNGVRTGIFHFGSLRMMMIMLTSAKSVKHAAVEKVFVRIASAERIK